VRLYDLLIFINLVVSFARQCGKYAACLLRLALGVVETPDSRLLCSFRSPVMGERCAQPSWWTSATATSSGCQILLCFSVFAGARTLFYRHEPQLVLELGGVSDI